MFSWLEAHLEPTWPIPPSFAELRFDWVAWGLPHPIPVPVSHAPPSEFFFFIDDQNLFIYSLLCFWLCVFTVFAFLRRSLLLPADSGSIQNVLQSQWAQAVVTGGLLSGAGTKGDAGAAGLLVLWELCPGR